MGASASQVRRVFLVLAFQAIPVEPRGFIAWCIGATRGMHLSCLRSAPLTLCTRCGRRKVDASGSGGGSTTGQAGW